MIHAEQFRKWIVRLPLKQGGIWSRAAEELLMGVAAHESHLGSYIEQLPDGPALGVYQMEPDTHDDIWVNFVRYRPDHIARLGGRQPRPERLVLDLRYATLMARVHFCRVPAQLPEPDDLDGMAEYWKTHWNTYRGAGTVEQFRDNYLELVGGPPHGSRSED